MNFTINHEMSIGLAEHQVLLNFINDSDVEPFLDWLVSDGWVGYEKWYEENKEEYKY